MNFLCLVVICVGWLGMLLQQPRPRNMLGAVSAIEDFGAKADDNTDDTAALQACIDYAGSHPAPCFLPPGRYKISGKGLSITSSGTSLLSWTAQGRGQAQIKYYGHDAALTIGDGSHMLYGVDLNNVAIMAADNTSARAGVDCRVLSGGNWQGLLLGGTVTNGKFETGIRFFDSGRIELRDIVISNRKGSVGSTAILFDERGSWGNSHLIISGGDFFNQNTMYDVKSCMHCVIENVFHEGYDRGVQFDSRRNRRFPIEVGNLVVQNNTFLATLADYYKERKVIFASGSDERPVSVQAFTFAGNYVFNAGGVHYPITLLLGRDVSQGAFNLTVRDGSYPGTENALVGSDSSMASIKVEGNPYIRSADRKSAPPAYKVRPN